MNNDEAKLILQAYRPGGKDANASNFQEALKQLQISPELAVWFAGEQALDSRISHKLNQSFEPPAHLKSFLLAQRKIVRPAVWWKKTHLQFGAAACLVLLATLTFVWVSSSRPIRFAQYREDMAA